MSLFGISKWKLQNCLDRVIEECENTELITKSKEDKINGCHQQSLRRELRIEYVGIRQLQEFNNLDNVAIGVAIFSTEIKRLNEIVKYDF